MSIPLIWPSCENCETFSRSEKYFSGCLFGKAASLILLSFFLLASSSLSLPLILRFHNSRDIRHNQHRKRVGGDTGLGELYTRDIYFDLRRTFCTIKISFALSWSNGPCVAPFYRQTFMPGNIFEMNRRSAEEKFRGLYSDKERFFPSFLCYFTVFLLGYCQRKFERLRGWSRKRKTFNDSGEILSHVTLAIIFGISKCILNYLICYRYKNLKIGTMSSMLQGNV